MVKGTRGSEGGKEGRRGVGKNNNDYCWPTDPALHPLIPPLFLRLLLLQYPPVHIQVHVPGGDNSHAFILEVVDPVVAVQDANPVAVVVLAVDFC